MHETNIYKTIFNAKWYRENVIELFGQNFDLAAQINGFWEVFVNSAIKCSAFG